MVDIVDPEGGLAQVAETRYQGDRLIVGRTRLIGAPAELFPTWRDHAVVTDRVGTAVWLDQDHRRPAVVELCIRDLKSGVGLRHCPFGQVQRQRRLAGGGHPGPQPAALGRCHRARRPRGAGGGQDPAPDPAGPARPADPLRQTPDPAPARRLAVAAWFELALARLRCIAYAT